MAVTKKVKKITKKRILIAALSVLAALILIVGGYVCYVIVSYERIPDNQTLEIARAAEVQQGQVPVNQIQSVMTYNLGFGAYSADYTFFMDGGKSSWAFSEQAVYDNIGGAVGFLEAFHPDFICLQEVDINSTRSYHINESEIISEAFPEYDSVFAYNYLNSPFLMWPLFEPHGTINAGVSTYSRYAMESSLRRSLPVMDNLNRFFDLDRCYTITRIPTENGAMLCLYNVHLSAYGNDGNLRERQIGMLLEDMTADYLAGNYVICGGDYNHNLKLKEEDVAAESWAQPFPRSMLPEGFFIAIDKFDEQRIATMLNSARDTDIPYTFGKSRTFMLDGFIVSDNVEVLDVNTVNSGFAFSDHNPIVMFFSLKQK